MSFSSSAPSRNKLVTAVEQAYRLAEAASSRSAYAYLQHVVIDSSPEPRLYREVARPWQWSLVSKVIPAIESIAGLRDDYTGPRCFWFTLPRGHDKTSMIGRLCSWALAFTRRRISAIAAAADRDQANILADFMEAEAKLNPWLWKRLGFKNYKVEGAHGSKLKILSADAYSAFGLKNHLIVCDEVTHWPKQDLWGTIMSGKDKIPDNVLIVISNAGVLKSWQHDALRAAQSSPFWYVYEAPGQLPNWMNAEKLAEVRRMLLPSEAKRVIDNRWIPEQEEGGFVAFEEAAACERLGEEMGLSYRRSAVSPARHFAAVDYGPAKDRTVMCVLHRDPDSEVIVVDRMDVLQGSREKRVRITAVEEWIDHVDREFHRPCFVFDDYQMESVLQNYEGRLSEVVRFTPRGGKANYELAQNLRVLIVNQRLAWYPGAGELMVMDPARGCHVPQTLTDEIADLVVKVTGAGYRIDHVGNAHDDRTVALGMAALQLVKSEEKRPFRFSELYF